MILKQNIRVLMIILVCYELTGPSGSMIVQVADMCPVSGNSVCVGIHFFISFTLSLLFFLIYIFCLVFFLYSLVQETWTTLTSALTLLRLPKLLIPPGATPSSPRYSSSSSSSLFFPLVFFIFLFFYIFIFNLFIASSSLSSDRERGGQDEGWRECIVDGPSGFQPPSCCHYASGTLVKEREGREGKGETGKGEQG